MEYTDSVKLKMLLSALVVIMAVFITASVWIKLVMVLVYLLISFNVFREVKNRYLFFSGIKDKLFKAIGDYLEVRKKLKGS